MRCLALRRRGGQLAAAAEASHHPHQPNHPQQHLPPPPGDPPLELVRAWEALCRAVGFCARSSKLGPAKQQQQQPGARREGAASPQITIAAEASPDKVRLVAIAGPTAPVLTSIVRQQLPCVCLGPPVLGHCDTCRGVVHRGRPEPWGTAIPAVGSSTLRLLPRTTSPCRSSASAH